jgi:hypothetical protein
VLLGSAGSDDLYGQAGADASIPGGAGNDLCNVGATDQVIEGAGKSGSIDTIEAEYC